MNQIKTFITPTDDEVNNWLEINPSVEIKSIIKTPMHDWRGYGAPEILNQWTDVTIIYAQHDRS